MKYIDRIEVKNDVVFGKPVIAGTRIAVEIVLQLLASGWTMEQVLQDYPNLKREDVLACMEYASNLVSEWSAFSTSTGIRYENTGE